MVAAVRRVHKRALSRTRKCFKCVGAHAEYLLKQWRTLIARSAVVTSAAPPAATVRRRRELDDDMQSRTMPIVEECGG
jgi:hypothetical protein